MIRRIDDIPSKVAEAVLTNEEIRNATLNALIYSLSSSHSDRLRLLESNPERPLSAESGMRKRSFETPTLLQLLGVDTSLARKDVKTVLRMQHTIGTRDSNRLTYVQNDDRFRRWYTSPRSSALPVELNDTSSPTAVGFTSVLTYLCAHFASNLASLKRSWRTVVLSYFCGVRARDEGADIDARDMLRSLLGQLLERWDNDEYSEPEVDVALEEKIRRGDMVTLCAVLQTLIEQLPDRWSVLILVDTIDLFETRERERKTRRATEGLLSMVDHIRETSNGSPKGRKKSGSVRKSVKILFTTPMRSRVIGDEIREKWILRVEGASFDTSTATGLVAS